MSHAVGNTNRTGLQSFNAWLESFSRRVTAWSGSSLAIALATLTIIIWAASGPLFHYSDTWQLVINTGTTIVTFLMVFLIQRAQNKDSLAIQVKLNELLASQPGASNRLINLENLSEEDITALHQRFARLRERLEHAADHCEAHSIIEAKEEAEAGEAHAEQLKETLRAGPRSSSAA